MKSFLGILFSCVILVTLCDAYCYFQLNDPLTSAAGCIQDGKQHQFGSSWTADCHQCHCSQHGIRCCSTFSKPSGYDNEKCESIFNAQTCSYTVVEKTNPLKACEVHGWVG